MKFILLDKTPNGRGPISAKTFLVMKLTILLTAICLQVSASVYSQKITLSEKNATLNLLFDKIKEQSGYTFFYNNKSIKAQGTLNIQLSNATIEEALNKILLNKPFVYSIVDKIVVVKEQDISLFDRVMDYFNAIDLTGKVVDEKGLPLPQATVKVKNANRIVFTNKEGQFELKGLQNDAVLVISFIGYKTKEVSINGSRFLNIQMEPVSGDLEQVMVTGYQTISKERATGAFSTVGSEMLGHRPAVSNLSSALQGMVAGMQAKENEDGSVSFLIRGNTSLYADSKPLIVVDGFPISSSDFSDINPNDVESVTVLKDAAAASIWGARSANGVIVVTTKKSKGNSKLNVDVNAFTRIANRPNLDQLLTQASSADQIAYERRAFDSNWSFSPYAGAFSDISKSLTLAQELLYANKNGQIDAATMNAGLDQLSKINNRSQIQDLLMQRAILNQYNLNLQAGTDRSRTYASVMYENSKGAYKKNGYDRFNLNFSNDFKLTNFLSFNFGANLQYKNQQTSGATISEIQNLSPYEVLLNPDGSYGTNLNVYNRAQLALIPTSKFPYSDWSYNLLREVNGRDFNNQNLSARIQAGLNLKIVKGLTFDSKFQYERIKSDSKNYNDENTFYVRSLVNSMTVYDNTAKTVGISYIPKGGIQQSANSDIESFLVRNQLNFDKNIGGKHSISVIAGTEISQYTTTGKTNPTVYGYFPDKLQATVPPYGFGSSVDQFKNFTGSTGVTIPGGNTVFSWGRDKYVSFYGNASYTYDNKYTVSGSARSDASNFITDDPKLRWSPLWSVGGKWNMKNENFLSNVESVDRLELRLTYGKNGNVEKSTSTKALVSLGSSLNATTGTITATISSNGNPGLRWEKTTTTDLGIDFALLKNKLFGSIDLYNKIGEGIIGNIALPAATGTTTQRFNNAGIANKGVELTLGANFDIPKISTKYTTSLTYAYNHNKITSLYNPSLYVYQVVDPTTFIEGRPVNSIYSFTYKGMVDGVPQVAGPGGTLQSFNDVTLYNRGLAGPFLNFEGTGTPPHTLGWVNNIRVTDFDLTFIFTGKFGGVYRNPIFNYASATIGSGKTFVNSFVSDVLAGNPNIPGFANPNETKLYLWDRYAPVLSSLVESSSYIECKEVTLQYTLSKKLARAIQVSNIKVFAQTRDLGLIWEANSKGYNPDWLPGTNRPVQTYTFGLNLQF